MGATSTTSTGTSCPQPTLTGTSTLRTRTVTGGRTGHPTLEAAATELTLTGTGVSTGQRPASALTHALRSTVAALPLTNPNLRTSATLSSLSTLFPCSDTPSTPTHSCGCGPTAMTMGRALKTTRRSSWLSTPAMLSSRFTAPSLTQSTQLI